MFGYNAYAQKEINLNKKQWLVDIDYLMEKSQNIVPDFKSRVNTTEFLIRVEQLKQNIETKSYEDIVFGMQYMLNVIEENGCNIIPFQKELDTKVLPIKNYWFDDGLFICDASKDYNTLKGEQIIKLMVLKLKAERS